MTEIYSTDDPEWEDIIASAIEAETAKNVVAIPGRITKVIRDGLLPGGPIKALNVRPVVRPKQRDPSTGATGDLEAKEVTNVPVAWPSGGGGDWAITWPLSEGDDVMLVFAHRSIDEWKNTGNDDQSARDERRFDPSDAMAVPSIRSPANPLPSDAFAQAAMILFGDEIRAGGSGATEPVAIASAVERWLRRYVNNFFNGHTHPDPLTGTVGSPTPPAIAPYPGEFDSDTLKSD